MAACCPIRTLVEIFDKLIEGKDLLGAPVDSGQEKCLLERCKNKLDEKDENERLR